jgi:hypothetical protein
MEVEEEEKGIDENINMEALDAALGDDDIIEIDEEIVSYSFSSGEDEEDLDIAFTDNDSRDWY